MSSAINLFLSICYNLKEKDITRKMNSKTLFLYVKLAYFDLPTITAGRAPTTKN